MLLLGHKSAEERVVSFLLAVHRKSAVGNDIHLPRGRLDMADYSWPDDRDSVENDDKFDPAWSHRRRGAPDFDLAHAKHFARNCRQH